MCNTVINLVATFLWRGWGWYSHTRHSPVLMRRNHSLLHGGPSHKQYLLMSPKRTQPHMDRVPNIYLGLNTGVFSTTTPLPSVWGANHINSTSSCHLHVSYLTSHGRGTQDMGVLSTRTPLCPCGTPITHTVPQWRWNRGGEEPPKLSQHDVTKNKL